MNLEKQKKLFKNHKAEFTYTGQNCRTSKPMLEVAMKALDKLKAGDSQC